MKKIVLVAAAATALLCVQADDSNALEFQRIGKLGVGGAGVATSTDSLAGYWNPAGLAFHQKSFSGQLGVGVGVNVSKGLADSVDKIDKMDLDGLKSLSTTNTTTTAAAADAAAKAAEFVGIALDIQQNGGTLSIAPTQVFSFQTGNVGIGLFGLSEVGAYISNVDTLHIMPDTYTTVPQLTDLGVSIGALTSTSDTTPATTTALNFFNAAQRTSIVNSLTTTGQLNATQALAVFNKLDTALASGNTTGQTPDQLAAAVSSIANTYAAAQASGSANLSIENNTTAVDMKGILLGEVPIAYGHKFDLGRFGQLGVGGSVKVMSGTTYAYRQILADIKDTEDLVDKMTESKKTSVNIGVDLGAMWRYQDTLSIGLVAKNLNAPEFDLPLINGQKVGDGKIKVDPQVRMGVAVDPFSWLTVAADLDVTENKTVLGAKSRILGGGVDIHPVSWFSVRGGGYNNIADSTIGPVATAGISLGPNWLKLNLDAAMGLETSTYDGQEFPREARVELSISSMF